MKINSQIFIIILITLLTAGICYSAGFNILTVNAVVLSKSNCKFSSATSTLDFGNLDPATPVDKTVTTSITFVCNGSAANATYSITDNDGSYETGQNASRMLNTTFPSPPKYLPYSLTYNPQTNTVPKGVVQTLTISGTVLENDFKDAYVGSYSDTVVLTLLP